MSKVYIAVDKTTAKVIGVYPTQYAARCAAARHVAGLFDESVYNVSHSKVDAMVSISMHEVPKPASVPVSPEPVAPPEHVRHPLTFQALVQESSALNESKDCSVKAVALTTGLPYKQVHAAFREAGRRSRRGTPRAVTERAIKKLGFKIAAEDAPVQPEGYRYTAKTISNWPHLKPSGKYIIISSGHMAAVVNGQVEDWTKNRRTRINLVWLIKKDNG